MRSSAPRLVLVTLVAAALAAGAAGTAAAEDTDRLAAQLGQRIDTGTEPQRDTAVEWGTAVGVVDAPFDAVMEVITEYGDYREFLPHFRRSRVLSQRGNNALVYLQANVVKGTVTLWAQMRIYERKTQGPSRVVEGRMMKGNMNNFVARWEVTPVDGGSRALVRFRILVDPDLPLPSSVFTKENRKSARKTVGALRERVRQQLPTLAQNR